MKKIFVILFSLVTTACTMHPEPIAYNCPIIILPSDPSIPLTQLRESSSSDEVIKAWVATAVAYRNWNKTVRKQVNNSK